MTDGWCSLKKPPLASAEGQDLKLTTQCPIQRLPQSPGRTTYLARSRWQLQLLTTQKLRFISVVCAQFLFCCSYSLRHALLLLSATLG